MSANLVNDPNNESGFIWTTHQFTLLFLSCFYYVTLAYFTKIYDVNNQPMAAPNKH